MPGAPGGPSPDPVIAAALAPAAPGFQRPLPGGPATLAPDGNHYIHAPHAGGIYRRVKPKR